MKSDHTAAPNHITSLQGLRACGFLAIFISHTIEGYDSFGAAGVSVFIVLSGFLMSYNYLGREFALQSPSLRSNLQFSVRKIRKLYPLHIVTMALTFCLILLQPERFAEANQHLFIKTVLNIFLVQSWIPKSEFYFSFNSVSWYLSTALFTYFIFPWLLSILRKITRKRTAVISILALLALEGVLSCVFTLFGSDNTAHWFSLHWLAYVSPLYRSIDFAVGAFAGWLFLHRKKKDATVPQRIVSTCVECILPLLMYGLCKIYSSTPQCFRYTLVFTVPCVLLVYQLAKGDGYISSLLSQRPFQAVGGMSAAAFLIHMPVVRFGLFYIEKYFSQLHIFLSALLLLLVTLLLSFAWNRLQSAFMRKGKLKAQMGVNK